MAKEREVKQWITINGAHVPIYADGSMGGIGAKLSESGKAMAKKALDFHNDLNYKDDEPRWKGTEESLDKRIDELEDRIANAYRERDKQKYQEELDDLKEIKKEQYGKKQEARVTKVGETSGGTFNPKEINEQIAREKAEKEEADRKLSEEANRIFKLASADVKRAAQAEVLKDYGIDRDAALEAIKARTGKSGEEAEKLMDNMDVAKIKKLAEEGAGKKKEDFVVDTPIKDDPDYDKKRIARETADENDAYDKEHKEGKYADDKKESGKKTYEPLTDEEHAVAKKYIEENDWVHEEVNRQLNAGEDWDKVMRQVHGAAVKYGNKESGKSSTTGKTETVPGISQNSIREVDMEREERIDRLEHARARAAQKRDLKTKYEEIKKERAEEQKKAKSIKIGNKEVAVSKTAGEPGIHETRMNRTVQAIKNGQNNLKDTPIGDLRELAITYGGRKASDISGMSKAELRQMLLAMWQK